jgi:hypothetical protein
VTGQEISTKKYIVKLSAEERERLNTLINAGKHPARILLKADISEVGEGWYTPSTRLAYAILCSR